MSQKSFNHLPQITLLALALLISMFIAACSKNANTGNSANTANSANTGNANKTSTISSPTTGMSPTDTVKAYFDAAYRKDVEAVKKYISQGSFKLMEDMAKAQGKTFEQMVKDNKEAQVTPQFSNETITGDTATVEIKDPAGELIKMPLIKEGGQWKLAIDKMLDDIKKDMDTPRPGKSNSNMSDDEDEHGSGNH